MSNNDYYSEIAEAYKKNRDCSPNICCDDKCNSNDKNRCCGKRFNNCTSSEKVQRALQNFAKQLCNTSQAINCLNQAFNDLEDDIYEDRCCVSNRIKNILRSIQSDICGLDDTISDIKDDLNCLNQAL